MKPDKIEILESEGDIGDCRGCGKGYPSECACGRGVGEMFALSFLVIGTALWAWALWTWLSPLAVRLIRFIVTRT